MSQNNNNLRFNPESTQSTVKQTSQTSNIDETTSEKSQNVFPSSSTSQNTNEFSPFGKTQPHQTNISQNSFLLPSDIPQYNFSRSAISRPKAPRLDSDLSDERLNASLETPFHSDKAVTSRNFSKPSSDDFFSALSAPTQQNAQQQNQSLNNARPTQLNETFHPDQFSLKYESNGGSKIGNAGSYWKEIGDKGTNNRSEVNRNTPLAAGAVRTQQQTSAIGIVQLKILFYYFDIDQNPTKQIIELISNQAMLSPETVTEWFRKEREKRNALLLEQLKENQNPIYKTLDTDRTKISQHVSLNDFTHPDYLRNFSKTGSDQQNISRPNPDFSFSQLSSSSAPLSPRVHFYSPFSHSNFPAISKNLHNEQQKRWQQMYNQRLLSLKSQKPQGMARFQSPYEKTTGIPYPQTSGISRGYQRGGAYGFSQNKRFSYSPYQYSANNRRRPNAQMTRRDAMPFIPSPPRLPKALPMLDMIKEAIICLNEAESKTNKLNIKTWIKDNYDVSSMYKFQENFNEGLLEGKEKNLFYEFSNTFRLTSSVIEEQKNKSNMYSDDEIEASCPISLPIPEGTKDRKEALRGFIMGEILAQDPYFSLTKNGIKRKIESMTPPEFRDWALFEDITDDEQSNEVQAMYNTEKESVTETDVKEKKIGIKIEGFNEEQTGRVDEEQEKQENEYDEEEEDENEENEDENEEEEEEEEEETEDKDEKNEQEMRVFSTVVRRNLRKTPTRILKEQMEKLKKIKKPRIEAGAGVRRTSSYAEEVLKELVATRRLAIWVKPTGKKLRKKKKIFFATKKSIQWKAIGANKIRIPPFSKMSKEEDEFFSTSDENNLSPQEEQLKREKNNAEIVAQIDTYQGRKAAFFVKHKKEFAPFISKEYMKTAVTLAKKASSKDLSLPRLIDPLKTQPECIHGTLRDYQLEGLNWLIRLYDNGLSGILGDEMGLGKTLQTISFISYLKFHRNKDGPYLIVCPLNVLTNWCNEFARWSPDLVVVRFHGPERELNRVLRDKLDIGTFDVIVTTFEMVLTAENVLAKRFFYQCVVVDEAHKVKNELAQISESLRNVTAFNKLLLTGTPLQNNLRELWSLLNFLYPEQFVSAGSFDKGFNLIGNKVNVDTMWASQQVLKLFMLRRLKADVANLPAKLETKVLVPMSECQVFWYKRLLAYQAKPFFKDSKKKKNIDKKSMKKLVTLIMELRKCCNHPFLFPNCEPDINDEQYCQRLIDSCGKMQVLDKMLKRLKDNKNRVLIFSQFTSVLDILEDYCRLKKLNYLRLDGNTNRVQRQFDISRFNKPGSPIFVYLITTRAGGIGVNLHTADTVIMYDSDWNPQADLQAQDRAHRIGQTKVVRVFRLITEGSIEERVALRAEKKLYLDAVVTTNFGDKPSPSPLKIDENKEGSRKKRMNTRSSKMSLEAKNFDENVESEFCTDDNMPVKKSKVNKRDLLSLLTFGAERIFSSKGKAVSDKDIDLILGIKTAKGKKQQSKLAADSVYNVANYDLSAGQTEITKFQGKDVKLKRLSNKDPIEQIAEEWAAANNRTIVVEAHPERDANLETVDIKYKRFCGHESHCHDCKQSGLLLLCEWCPRSYHPECLGLDSVPDGSFKCPQHKCEVCFRSAHEAGGMLFRCVSCPHCSCDDHVSLDIVPVEKCESLEALGYKKSSSACYVICGKECLKREQKAKDNETSKNGKDTNKTPWNQLPTLVQRRIEKELSRSDNCDLASLPGFSKRLLKINQESTLLTTLHFLLYESSTHSQTHTRIASWKGLQKSASREIAAKFYQKVTKELSSWRIVYVLFLANLLGLWTRSEPKLIKGGTSKGKLTKPKDRKLSAIDSEERVISHIAIFLIKPSVFGLYVHFPFLKPTIDELIPLEDFHLIRDRDRSNSSDENSEEDFAGEEVEKTPKGYGQEARSGYRQAEHDGSAKYNRAAEAEEIMDREVGGKKTQGKREIVVLRRTGRRSYEVKGVIESLKSRLRPRRKKRFRVESNSFSDFDEEYSE